MMTENAIGMHPKSMNEGDSDARRLAYFDERNKDNY